MEIWVSKDGTGDFNTIQAAVDYAATLPETDRTVRIKRGVYRERVAISVPHITLTGDSPADTVLVSGCSARETGADGQPLGTFRTQTLKIETHHISVRGLTVKNDAGPGWKAAQAIAVYADGDRVRMEDCRLLGHQDTLFTGPRLARLERGEFDGKPQRQIYRNCYIEGDVDFVFGCACAYFENCEFFSVYSPCPEGKTDYSQAEADRDSSIAGYVTAAATPKGQRHGFVMNNCRFTGDCPPGSVFLGRPWRDDAKVVLQNCYLGEHIHPEGWHDWGRKGARDTVFFAEYGCYGPGAGERERWIRV